MNLGTHKAVFQWVLKGLAGEGLLSLNNLGVDATTPEANAALYPNRRRLSTKIAKALTRRRGELIERSLAHPKRALIHAAAFNLSLILRQMSPLGTARQPADLFAALYFAFLRLTQAAQVALLVLGSRGPLPRPARERNRCRCSHRGNAPLSTGC